MHTASFHHPSQFNLFVNLASSVKNVIIGLYSISIRLSNFFLLSLILVIALIPAILITILLVLILKITFYKMSRLLSEYQKEISEKEDRVLMIELVKLEISKEKFKNLDISGKNKFLTKLYRSLFLGYLFTDTLERLNSIISSIEVKVYPNFKNEPSQEQLKRLSKAYQDVDLAD